MALRPRLSGAAAAAAAVLVLALNGAAVDALAWPASAFVEGLAGEVSVAALGDWRDEAGWQADLSDLPIKFYGTQYPAVYTSDNGYIVFGETFYPYDPSQFGTMGAGAPKVAPFFSDVSLLAVDADGNYVGDIKYRLSDAGSDDANDAKSLISRAFSKAAAFTPSKVLISTWDGVLPGKYIDDPNPDPAKSNSFQAMLAWDASRTFSCFFYPQNGIQWTQATTMNSPAAVGFEKDDASDTDFELLPYSRNSAQLPALTTGSNMGEPGTWCFQIDTNVVAGTPPPPPPPPPKVTGTTPTTPTKAPTPAPTKATPAPAPPVKLSALQQLLAQLQKQLQAYLKSLLDKAKAAKLKPNPNKKGGKGRRLL